MSTPNKFLLKAFADAASLTGWDTRPAYDPATRKSRIGAHFIQRAATERPLWRVVSITSEGGGERVVHRHANAMPAAELESWLRGIIHALEAAQ